MVIIVYFTKYTFSTQHNTKGKSVCIINKLFFLGFHGLQLKLPIMWVELKQIKLQVILSTDPKTYIKIQNPTYKRCVTDRDNRIALETNLHH